MSLRFVSHINPAHLGADCVLGSFEVGATPSPVEPAWPLQRVTAPVAFPLVSHVHEAWLADVPVLTGVSEGVAWRQHQGVLFGVISLDEAAASEAGNSSPVRAISEQAYARIFRLLDAQGVPNLWRVWNYIPDINGEQAGLERYRQFNMGRGDAFESGERSVIEQVPAACALGVTGGPLTISFIAGDRPLMPIENPRQVSAYRYPKAYGPRSPTFSRAGLVQLGEQWMLFVSGTASIVGHETVHLGDVVAQAKESLTNVQALLIEAKAQGLGADFSLVALTYRVYVRRAADVDLVRSVVAEHIGEALVHYVVSDICRSDLLVEVEAFGQQPVQAAA